MQKLKIYDQDSMNDHEYYLSQEQIQILKWKEIKDSFEQDIQRSSLDQQCREDLLEQSKALEKLGFFTIKFAGKGSFGSVLVAKDENGCRFAFKFIYYLTKQGKENIKIKENAEKEIRIMKNINHENVIKYLDSFYQDGYIIIQMEECRGTLGDLIKQEEFLSIPSFIKYGREIVEGVYHIHTQGIIIRDLKPDNILIDMMNIAKISDFGLAAHTSQNASFVSYSLAGAPIFLAPELQTEICKKFVDQLKLEDSKLVMQSKKSDIFSIGLIFYYCLGSPLQDFLKLIQEGPQNVEMPIMIRDQIELDFIQKLLQSLCQRHPNNRIKMEELQQCMKKLSAHYIPNLQVLPKPLQIQYIRNDVIIIQNTLKKKVIEPQEEEEQKEYQQQQHSQLTLKQQMEQAEIVDQSLINNMKQHQQQFELVQKKNKEDKEIKQCKLQMKQRKFATNQNFSEKITKYKKIFQNYSSILQQFQNDFIGKLKEEYQKSQLLYYLDESDLPLLSAHLIFEDLQQNEIGEELQDLITSSHNSFEFNYIFGEKIRKHLFLKENYEPQSKLYMLEYFKYFHLLQDLDTANTILDIQHEALKNLWIKLSIDNDSFQEIL